MKTVSTKTKAWISPHSSVSPADLIAGERIDDLHFSLLAMERSGWTYVGDAEITVQIIDEKSMIGNKVEALRNEAAAIRAEATARVTHIESQIKNLLAISYDPTSTGAA